MENTNTGFYKGGPDASSRLQNQAQAWLPVLNNIGAQLTGISELSENQFLLISEKLHSFHSISKSVSGKAFDVTKTLSGERYKNNVEKLKSVFDLFSAYLTNVKDKFCSSGDSLNEIVKFLNRIAEDVLNFKKLVRQLDVQGIAIKIESARLGNDEKGFNVLADNISRLASIISNKSLAFRERTGSLFNIIGNVQSQMRKLELSHQKHSETIINNTRISLTSLIEKYESSSSESGVIHKTSESIYRQISSLVTAIQFHDITRQQRENVSQAVKNLEQKIKGARKSFDLQNEEDRRLITYVHEVSRLQSAQLQNSKNELYNAATGIISSLEEIKKDISEIEEEILKLLENTENDRGSFIEKISKEITEIVSGLMQNEDVGKQFSASIENVASTIGSLSEFINEIGSIGTEIELISLNAIIKAAHTGKNGAALGVLAEATQKLSIVSKKDTGLVIDMLMQVTELSTNLSKSNKGILDEEKFHLNKISEDIREIFQPLDLIVKKAVTELNFIRDSVIKIKKELKEGIDSLKAYLEVDSTLNNIITEFEIIVNQTKDFCDKDLLDEIKFEGLKKNYTMQVQRDIHESISQKNMNTDNGSYLNQSDGRSTEFGSNVELF